MKEKQDKLCMRLKDKDKLMEPKAGQVFIFTRCKYEIHLN